MEELVGSYQKAQLTKRRGILHGSQWAAGSRQVEDIKLTQDLVMIYGAWQGWTGLFREDRPAGSYGVRNKRGCWMSESWVRVVALVRPSLYLGGMTHCPRGGGFGLRQDIGILPVD